MTTSDPPPAADRSAAPMPLHEIRGLVTTATQRLLGDTISVSDSDWLADSLLPGWTRSHVASHLARQADALTRLTSWARTGDRQEMYADDDQRNAEIEAGAGRTGLEIQIDLDTSAGRLGDEFEALDDADGWDAMVELRGAVEVRARVLPLARLNEVVLHHVDLDIGFGIDDVDGQTAEWLLEWCSFRMGAKSELAGVTLISDSGFSTSFPGARATEVRGSSARLLGWLTGRGDGSGVAGADQVHVPSL